MKMTLNQFKFVVLIYLGLNFSVRSYSATCVAIASNDWSLPATWSCGRPPACGDSLVIPAGFTVTIKDVIDYQACFPQTLDVTVAGTLTFQTGKKLYLPCNSQLTVLAGGQITSGGGGGNSNLISICNVTVWNTASGTLSGPVSLPVELISFSGNQINNSILLQWVTATEMENDYFTIERSKDGGNFSTVGIVYGSGNSQTIKEYNFVDQMPLKGINYYRLKQTDIDNDFQYLKIIAVPFNGKFSAIVYPNPASFKEGLFAELMGFENSVTEIFIYDSTGKLVFSQTLIPETENLKVPLNIQNCMGSGLFQLIIKNPNQLLSFKINVI